MNEEDRSDTLIIRNDVYVLEHCEELIFVVSVLWLYRPECEGANPKWMLGSIGIRNDVVFISGYNHLSHSFMG